MSAELLNLRKARKARQRVEDDARAAANRARFGRTRAERNNEEAARARDARDHDGRKLEG